MSNGLTFAGDPTTSGSLSSNGTIGATSLSWTGSVGAGATCISSQTVTGTPGVYDNATSALSTSAGSALPATATLTIVAGSIPSIAATRRRRTTWRSLPATGGDTGNPLGIALILLGVGATMFVLARGRRGQADVTSYRLR